MKGDVIPEEEKGSNKKQKEELFDYLAYHGVKNVKAMEYAKKKTETELADCTFKPQIIKYSKNTPSKGAQDVQGSARVKKGPVFDHLAQSKRDHAAYEGVKQKLEMKNCTF